MQTRLWCRSTPRLLPWWSPIRAHLPFAQAQATLQLVRDKFPHLRMGADIERLFPKAVLDVVAVPLGLDRGAGIEDEENQQDIDLGR